MNRKKELEFSKDDSDDDIRKKTTNKNIKDNIKKEEESPIPKKKEEVKKKKEESPIPKKKEETKVKKNEESPIPKKKEETKVKKEEESPISKKKEEVKKKNEEENNFIVKKKKNETYVMNCSDNTKRNFNIVYYDEDNIAVFCEESLLINYRVNFEDIGGKFKKNLTYEGKLASGFLFEKSEKDKVVDLVEEICKDKKMKAKGRGRLLRSKFEEIKKIIKDDYRNYQRETLEINDNYVISIMWGKDFQFVYEEYKRIIKGNEEEYDIIINEQFGSTGCIMYIRKIKISDD